MSLLLPRWKRFLVIAVVTSLLAACASHKGFDSNPDGSIEPYGLFSGIWHGLILPFALALLILVEVFKAGLWVVNVGLGAHHAEYLYYLDVNLVGQPNTGLFYYIGYLIGLSQYGNGASRIGQNKS